MQRYDALDERLPAAAPLARALLDAGGLVQVRVEPTDLGAHYDPVAKTVRIPRARFERASLTAAATVAHEVGHALQDAEGYWPFRLHLALSRVSRISGELGTGLLLAVPVAALLGQGPLPSVVVGGAAAAMLFTSLAAQLAALPSELDASFARALPMLAGEGALADARRGQARWLLLACSTTYLSAPLNPLLILWSWFGLRGPVRIALLAPAPDLARDPARNGKSLRVAARGRAPGARATTRPRARASARRCPLGAACAPGDAAAKIGATAEMASAARAAGGRPRWAKGVQDLARPWVRLWLRHSEGHAREACRE
jgi:hypothetical protein